MGLRGLQIMVALFALGFDSAFATTIGPGQTVSITDPSVGAGQNINFDGTLTEVTTGTNEPYDTGAGLVDLGPGTPSTTGFIESLGSGAGQVQWTGSGGFITGVGAAGEGVVNIGNMATPETLTWGTGGFVPVGSALVLSAVELENGIDLGTDTSATREIDIDLGVQFRGNITGSGNLLLQAYGQQQFGYHNAQFNKGGAGIVLVNISGGLYANNVSVVIGGILTASSIHLNEAIFEMAVQGTCDVTMAGGSRWSLFAEDGTNSVTQFVGQLNSTDSTSIILLAGAGSAPPTSAILTVQSGYFAGNIFEYSNQGYPNVGIVAGYGGSLVKNGPGFFTLANDNSGAGAPSLNFGYSNGTTINQGTLLVENTTGSATGTGAITVKSGGSLGGSGFIAPTGTSTVSIPDPTDLIPPYTRINDLVVESGGKIDLDAFDPAQSSAASINTLTIGLHATDAATFETGAGFVIDLGPGGTSDAVAFKNLTANVPKVFFNNNPVDLDFLAGAGDGTYTIFTFDQTGAYSGTLQNGPNYTFNYNPTSITVTVNSASVRGFSEWGAQFPALVDGSAVDTPLHDGVPTLLKYFYDINPGLPMSAHDRAALPVLGATSDGTTQYLTLTYRQYSRLDNGSVQVAVETSSDLKTWSVDSAPADQPAPTGFVDSVTGDPFMVVKTPMTAAKQFIRLRVSMP
jgi:hypothetical protein